MRPAEMRVHPEASTETRSFADAVSRVFFTGGAADPVDDRYVIMVDDLLSDGLLAAERFEKLQVVAPDVRPDAVDELVYGVMKECLETVLAVRYRQISREECRQLALITHDHVIRTFGSNAATAPMLQALAALYALPDGPDHFVLANNPEPDPGVPFEAVIAATLAGADDETMLVDALATSSFIMPVLGASLEERALELQFLPVTTEHGPAVAAWTSQARFDEYRPAINQPAEGGRERSRDERAARSCPAGGVYPMVITGAELRDLCPPGHGVIVNPGALLSVTLPEASIRQLSRCRVRY